MPTAFVSPYNPLQQQGVRAIQPPDLIVARTAPTSANYTPSVGTLWLHLNTGAYILLGKPLNVANWQLFVTTAGSLNTLTGNSGGAISPVAGNINILGAGGVTVAGSGSTLTISSTSVPPPVVVAINTAGVTNTAYIANANSTIQISLPAVSALGDTFEVLGNLNTGGSAQWQITQGAGQQIRFGNGETTAGAGGTLTSNDYRQSVLMRCIVANLTWVAVAASGTITPA